MGYSHKLIYGIGINDLHYNVNIGGRGQQERCPFYLKWKDLIRRCYHDKFKESEKSYSEATTCDEWIRASIFKGWMESKNWKGNHLDKDLLIPGNKVYGPDTCVFIPSFLNQVIKSPPNPCDEFNIGVRERVSKSGVKTFYTAKVNSGDFIYNSKTFETAQEAHINWQNMKIAYFYHNKMKYVNLGSPEVKVLEALDRIVESIKMDILHGRATTNW